MMRTLLHGRGCAPVTMKVPGNGNPGKPVREMPFCGRRWSKKSYFYAQFMRISAHRGKKRAYVAVAHSMLVAIYHILKDGVVFKDLGADYYNQFNKERKIKAYLKKLKALGWEDSAAGQPA